VGGRPCAAAPMATAGASPAAKSSFMNGQVQIKSIAFRKSPPKKINRLTPVRHVE
jgi:hypothetical protein